MISLIKNNSIESLFKAIIRPPRQNYTTQDLGPAEFQSIGSQCKRSDHSITIEPGLTIKASLFEPIKKNSYTSCIVYFHGNSGSRLNSLDMLNWILPLNICLISFDFLGCGLSDGEYVTLGLGEAKQALKVLRYFKEKAPFIKAYCLWGRSMGAVVALNVAQQITQKDIPISCMILDSPFSNLRDLAKELFQKHSKLPGFIFNILWSIVRKKILSINQLDLDALNILPFASKCTIPAIYCAGIRDSFVTAEHSKALYSLHKSDDKLLVNFDGDHNSKRPTELYESLINFIVYRIPRNPEHPAHKSLYGGFRESLRASKTVTSGSPSLLSFFETEAMDVILDKAFQEFNFEDLKDEKEKIDNGSASTAIQEEVSLPSLPKSLNSFQRSISYFEKEKGQFYKELKSVQT